MKILDSFTADDGKKKTKIELIQLRLRYSFPKRYCYAIIRNHSFRGFFSPFSLSSLQNEDLIN